MTESQALQRSRDGDPEAFRHLVGQYQDELFRTATLLTGSQSLAEDQVRRAFRAAWHGLQAAGWRAPVKPWLVRILVCQETDRDPPPTPVVRPPHLAHLRQLPPPLEPGKADFQRHEVRRALGALNPVARHLLILRYYAGLPVPQLAAVLEVSEDTVEVRRRQALGQLRVRLQANGAHAADATGADGSDQVLVDALRDYFRAATAAVRVPQDLWAVLDSRAPDSSCVARVRRKVLAIAQRFWTPLAATGGAAALASAVVCASTA